MMKLGRVCSLRRCKNCGRLGDGRRMLQMHGGDLWHDYCVTATLTPSQILRLPAAERRKITADAAGATLMRKLVAARQLELVKG